jgi:hypothetical protein
MKTVIRILVVSTFVASFFLIREWLEKRSESQAQELFYSSATDWGLKPSEFFAQGVTDSSNGVTVRSWVRKQGDIEDGIDITLVEGLVCRWQRVGGNVKRLNLGCLTRP